jgi:hypothetical protein
MDMIDRAVTSGASVEALEKLMALQERWEANQGRKAFDQAIAEAKAKLPAIIKNQTANRGNAGSYKYEDLAQIAAQIDPVLSEFGLSYRFRTDTDGGKIKVTCIVSHREGYSETTSLESGADTSGAKNAIQAMGSAVTYLQRYTLKAALGLAASRDDDTKATKAAPVVEAMSAEDFTILRERINAQGEDAGKVEDFILDKFGVDVLHDLTRQQMQAALGMIRKREQSKAGQ